MGELKPLLSLTMIVKNEEKYLEECLESVKGLADEIILVDTGSTDKTVEIAKKHNAIVYSFVWINDFSAARNFALSKATGNWILYLDADERIDPGSIKEINRIKKTNEKKGFFCTVKSIDNENNRDNSMRYIRLFKNIEGISFSGRVHEQISASLLKKGISLLNSSIVINHLGYNIPIVAKKEKAERNLILLENEYQINKDGYIAYQLANTYSILENMPRALEYFQIAAASEGISKFLRADCYTNLALAAHKEYNSKQANEFLEKSLQLNDDQPFAYLLKSKIKLMEGDKVKSGEFCRKAFNLNKKALSSSPDNDLYIFLNAEEVIGFGLYLAVQAGRMENLQFYLKEYQKYLKSDRNRSRLDAVTLVTKLLSKSPLTEEEEIGLQLIMNKNTSGFFYTLLENSVQSLNLSLIEQLYELRKGELGAVKLLCRYYFENDNVEKAIQISETNSDTIKSDPSAILLLISNYILIGNLVKGEEWLGALETAFGNLPQITPIVENLRGKILILKNN